MLQSFLQYQVVREIGRGAKGVVYLVEKDGTQYALKTLLRDESQAYLDSVIRFRQESFALSRLQHPGIVGVHETGESEGVPFLVMEFVDGRDLRSLLKAGPLSKEQALNFARQLASALQEIHRLKMVHRDIKPENIVLSQNQTLKLLDFGMVSEVGQSLEPSENEAVVGTVMYAAPEQCGLLQSPVNESSDLYSLGVVMYEMLTGQPPFDLVDPSQLLQFKKESRIKNIHSLDAKHSFVLGQIICKLLEFDPTKRYQSAKGFLGDLENLQKFEENLKNKSAYELGGLDRHFSLQEGPLAGRRAEFEDLQKLWVDSKNQKGGVALIEAASGIGKTRLATEVMRKALADEGIALSARCSRMENLSMAPILALLKLRFNQILLLPIAQRTAALASLKALPASTLQTLFQISPDFAKSLDLNITARGTPTPSQEVWIQQLIQLLNAIVGQSKALLLVIEDVHWLDEASLEFIKRFSREIPKLPIMLVLTSRNDPEFDDELSTLKNGIKSSGALQLKLNPLSAAEAQSMISGLLGGVAVEARTAELITKPTNGNPFALREYVSDLLDGAILSVEHGKAHLLEARMAEIGISLDAARMIEKRIATISKEDRRILTLAAVKGPSFSIAELGQLTPDPELRLRSAAQAAVLARLLETTGHQTFAFTHEKIREAVVAATPKEELKDAHDTIAAYLEKNENKKAEVINALADHYMHGHPRKNLSATIQALQAAGNLALETYAHRRAYQILQFANTLIQTEKLDPAANFKCIELYGIAAHNISQYEEASAAFERLLPLATNPVIKGRLLYWKMKIENGQGRMEEAWDTFLQALKTLGKSYPKGLVMSLLSTLGFFIIYCLQAYSRVGYNRSPKDDPRFAQRRAKAELLSELLEIGFNNCFIRSKTMDACNLVFRTNVYSFELGPSLELARALSSSAAVLAIFRLRRLVALNFKDAYAIAEELGDEGLPVHIGFHYMVSRLFLDRIEEYDRIFPSFLDSAERLLPYWNLGSAIIFHSAVMGQRGDFLELNDFYFRKLHLIDETRNLGMMADFRQTYASRLELVGRVDDAQNLRAEAQKYFQQIKDSNVLTRDIKGGIQVFRSVERGEFYDQATENFVNAFLKNKPSGFFLIFVYVWIAQFRQSRYELSPDGPDRERYLKEFQSTLKILKRKTRTRFVDCITKNLMAAEARFTGNFARAEELIEMAEQIAENCRSANGTYQAFVERARLAKAKGLPARMIAEAKAAYQWAEARSWILRMQRLETEFGPLALVDKASTVDSAVSENVAVGLSRDRAMNALLEISAAASRSIDPLVQGRLTLDTVVRLLGAERACIFLGTQSDALRFFLGRTASGDDIQQMQGFSTTVIKKVFAECKPMIITGTDQGEALGSKSIVAHNLKSIMVVPLVLAEDIKGVIYLDSSVTKGLFSDADLDLFVAVSTQIAASIRFSELAAVENERQLLKKDLELSASVQKMFLPQVTDFKFENISLAGFYRPATQCGGDWWWYKTTDDKLCIMVGDVTGHGAGPAMITASIASGYRIWDKTMGGNVKELILATNEQLFEISKGEYSMSMFGCEIDRKTKLIRFWSAGAPLAVILHKDSKDVTFLGDAGELLGQGTGPLVLGHGEYQARTGDRLFIYSDGISEMTTPDGQAIGDRRLCKMAGQFMTKSVQESKSGLVTELDKRRGDIPQDDDFTFVFVDID